MIATLFGVYLIIKIKPLINYNANKNIHVNVELFYFSIILPLPSIQGVRIIQAIQLTLTYLEQGCKGSIWNQIYM